MASGASVDKGQQKRWTDISCETNASERKRDETEDEKDGVWVATVMFVFRVKE